MLNKFKKQMKNEKGLTLIELLAVIVVLAIVAAIAVPAIGNVINNSKDKAILADASIVLSGAKIAVIDGACTESDTKGDFTCSNDQLKDFVEGIKGTDPVFSVAKNGGTWSVTYNLFGSIKNQTRFAANIDGTTMSEDVLNANME